MIPLSKIHEMQKIINFKYASILALTKDRVRESLYQTFESAFVGAFLLL